MPTRREVLEAELARRRAGPQSAPAPQPSSARKQILEAELAKRRRLASSLPSPLEQEIGPVPPGAKFEPFPEVFASEPLRIAGHDIPLTATAKRSLPFFAAADVARADNPEETEMILRQRFGKENVFRQPDDSFFVRMGGRLTPVTPGLWAQLLSGTPAAAGAAGGALAGAAVSGPFAPVGAIVGAIVGSAAGKGTDEAVKAVQGYWRKNFRQEIDTLSATGLLNGALETVGLANSAVARGLPPLIRRLLGLKVTDEARALTERTMMLGEAKRAELREQALRRPTQQEAAAGLQEAARRPVIVPPVRSVANTARVLAYNQNKAIMTRGDPLEPYKVEIVQDEMKRIMSLAGIPPQEAQEIINISTMQPASLSSVELGTALVEGARARLAARMDEAGAALAPADEELRSLLVSLEGFAKANKGELTEDIASGISRRRQRFAKVMDMFFDRAHEAAGGKAVIPTTQLRDALKSAISSTVPEGRPAIFAQILDEIENTPGKKLTLKRAHEIESHFDQLAWPHRGGVNLTPDLTQHLFDETSDAMGADMDNAFLGNAPRAVAMLRHAQNLYRIGIRKYRDEMVRSLVKEGRSAFAVEPGTVAAMIARRADRPKFLRFLVATMTPQSRSRLAAADAQNILFSARRSSGGLAIDPALFMQEIGKRDKLFEVIYGKQNAAFMRRTVQAVQRRGGTLDARIINPENLPATLNRAAALDAARDDFIRHNIIEVLIKGDAETIDKAFNMVVRPNAENLLQTVVNFYGKDSEEISILRQHALKVLAQRALERHASGNALVIGNAIEANLAQLTSMQQHLLFPNGMSRDLVELSKLSRALFPQQVETAGRAEFGTSLAAAQVMAGIERGRFTPYLYTAFMGWVARQPSVLKAIANLNRERGARRVAAINAVSILWRTWANSEQQRRRAAPAPISELPILTGSQP